MDDDPFWRTLGAVALVPAVPIYWLLSYGHEETFWLDTAIGLVGAWIIGLIPAGIGMAIFCAAFKFVADWHATRPDRDPFWRTLGAVALVPAVPIYWLLSYGHEETFWLDTAIGLVGAWIIGLIPAGIGIAIFCAAFNFVADWQAARQERRRPAGPPEPGPARSPSGDSAAPR